MVNKRNEKGLSSIVYKILDADQEKQQKILMICLLVISCILIGGCGALAIIFDKEVEDVLVLSSAVANSLALISISWNIYRENKEDKDKTKKRFLLTIETFAFSAILGSDVQHFFNSDQYRLIPLILALMLSVGYTTFLALSKKPNNHIGGLVTSLLFSISIFLVPALIEKVTIFSVPPFIYQRVHSWVHLLLIPIIYMICDYIYVRWDSSWNKYHRLDWGLMFSGIACALAGFAIKDPKFEAGAAAVIMLLGNWWFMNLNPDSQRKEVAYNAG